MPRQAKDIMIFERQLKRKEPPKTDVEAVIRFLLYGDVKLTPQQQELSERLLFVDEHLRARKLTTEEIVQLVMKRFEVTEYRAQRDINECQKVYGETRKLNKSYLMSHHIIEIGRQIQKLMDTKKDELIAKYLPKFNDNLTYALNSLPVETEQRESPPAQIIFVYNGKPPVKEKDLDEVLAEADEMIKTPTNGDYLEYTEGETGDYPGAEPSADDGADDPSE